MHHTSSFLAARMSEVSPADPADPEITRNLRQKKRNSIVPRGQELNHAILKSGPVERLKTDLTWTKRSLTLSTANLSFADVGDDGEIVEQRVIDYIPLHEIVRVRYTSVAAHDSLFHVEHDYSFKSLKGPSTPTKTASARSNMLSMSSRAVMSNG
eukprot:1120956-Rhodomonas_salina.2